MRETQEPCKILREVKGTIMHRAVLAWERSPETFGEELRALNDIDEAIRSNCRKQDI